MAGYYVTTGAGLCGLISTMPAVEVGVRFERGDDSALVAGTAGEADEQYAAVGDVRRRTERKGSYTYAMVYRDGDGGRGQVRKAIDMVQSCSLSAVILVYSRSEVTGTFSSSTNRRRSTAVSTSSWATVRERVHTKDYGLPSCTLLRVQPAYARRITRASSSES